MSDYDLSGLSARSFEQLVQALAARFLGPGVVVFGDGPDGGREATFEGPVPFPSSAQQWNGYLVVQAKFRQMPRGGSDDTAWLAEQISRELRKFKAKKKRRRPHYYILATNVYLTASEDTGGIDRCSALLSDLGHPIGLRDFRIWDGNQIRAFLDIADDVRRSYTAWITPGDVLSSALQMVERHSIDFDTTLGIFLQKELISDTYVNLQQAGHSVDERKLLARVFVDLPVAQRRHLSLSAKAKKKKIVQLILEVGDEKLDPKTTLESYQSEGLGLAEDTATAERGRFVILGGPGQGKTTVGQFVVQLYRLRLLQCRPAHALSPEVRPVMAEIAEQCRKEQIQLPVAKRFPLRVVLSKFAAAPLPNGEEGSLLSYLAGYISSRAIRPVSASEFRRWLAAYPWILILDGLDEVPASSNRDEVLRAVKECLVDIAADNADILIVATSRPQGYNNDFSPSVYAHWWLASLAVVEALHYGTRLAEEQYRTDEDRKQKVLERLQRAAGHEATRRLMQTPLQVTILAALLDQIGQAPRDR